MCREADWETGAMITLVIGLSRMHVRCYAENDGLRSSNPQVVFARKRDFRFVRRNYRSNFLLIFLLTVRS